MSVEGKTLRLNVVVVDDSDHVVMMRTSPAFFSGLVSCSLQEFAKVGK